MFNNKNDVAVLPACNAARTSEMTYLIANDLYHVVLGTRIHRKGALAWGIPWYKYTANRLLTLFQNILMNARLSEYHNDYRFFSQCA